MGTCFGHCLNSSPRRHDRYHLLYGCGTEYVQFGQGSSRDRVAGRRLRLPKSLSSLLFSRRKQPEPRKELVELVENSWSFECCDGYVAQPYVPSCNHIEPTRTQPDLEFEALDPKALLAPQKYSGFCWTQENKSLHSTPPSSIDLEWEHEALCNSRALKDEDDDSDSAAASLNNNIRFRPYTKSVHHVQRTRFGSRQGSITQDSSTGSKEGSRMTTPDSLEWDFVDSSIPTIDQETEQLIAEIERLAANALQETGQYSLATDDKSVTELKSVID